MEINNNNITNYEKKTLNNSAIDILNKINHK